MLISSAALYLSLDRGLQTYITGYGEISHITLPDGSSVVLNANSSIQFDDWHQQGARKVRLEGEAFFKVVHTKNHQAFIVHTRAADIEVLGTEFNVKERRNTTEVVLSSGKVKLNTDKLPQEGMYMVPGELVQLAATGNVVRHEVVDPDQFSAWTNKELVFNGAPLSEIARTLEDNYGWKSKFEGDSIKYYRFTGTVSTVSVADIELLLYSISEAFDIAVIKENNQITFRKVGKR